MNIASGIQITLLELLKKINEILGTNVKPKFEEFRKGDIKDSFADISFAKKLIDFEVIVPFEEGLQKTIKFFLNNKN